MKKIIPLFLVLLLSGCWTNQQGEKSGLLVKVAKEGTWWGTYEAELIRGGLDNGSGANGKEFHFTIGQTKNAKVIKAIEAMNKGKPVVISYHCEAFRAPWRGKSHCFLDAIKEHNEKTITP